jgi:hypothetical protein
MTDFASMTKDELIAQLVNTHGELEKLKAPRKAGPGEMLREDWDKLDPAARSAAVKTHKIIN